VHPFPVAMAQESTAIRDLIHLAQAKRIDFDEPAPDLFSVPPSQPAVSLRPVSAPIRPIPAPAPTQPAPMPAMQAKQYRIPTVVQREDEETEMWNTAAHDTSPAVPKILPNVATMVAQPQQPSRAVPSILSGPTAPQPQPRPQQPVPHAVLPQVAQPIAPGFHASATKPRSSTIAPKAPAPYLVARELASSAFRSRGGLAALAVLALGVGVYLAVASSRGEAKPQAPTDRDRAIAIMNGTAQPDPPSVKAPTPPTPTTVVAPVATSENTRPTSEPIEPIEPVEAKPTSEPIEPKPTSEPIEDKPTAPQETASEVVADASVSVDDIEMEPAAARPAKRASRSSRKAKKTVAVVEKASKRSSDPVLAILDEKPVKKTKTEKLEKPKAGPKAPKNLAATEIAAPRGAATTTGTGKVTIASDKPALVFLDGRPTGKTAPTALVIPAGDHQITLLDPDTKKAKTATIKLEANKSVAISKTFN